MDIEDPINPLADDAALDFARLLSEHGVCGSLCITGEKCRLLVERGRHDVIAALSSHCLGLHTDTHSVHPTTMELLETCTFEVGRKLALGAETHGLEKFRTAFGRNPVFWGGAGNTWSPEIAAILPGLGIPAYSYALTEVPGQQIHSFERSIAFPQHLSISEPDWIAGSNLDILDEMERKHRPWTGLFVGHPTRFRYSAFWDAPYAKGRQPAIPEPTPPVSDQDYERAMENLGTFMTALKSRFEVVGLGSEIALLQGSERRKSTADERAFFETQTAANIRAAAKWPIHREDLDPEHIVAKTISRQDLDMFNLDESETP